MEDHVCQPGKAAASNGAPARDLIAERERISAYVAAQLRQLDGLEATIAAQVAALGGQLSARLAMEHQQRADELDQKRRLLDLQAAQLTAECKDLALLQTRTEQQRQRLADHFTAQRQDIAELQSSRDTAADHGRCAAQLRRIEAERDDLERQLDELAAHGTAPTSAEPERTVQELERRLERTLNDLRDLKRRNGELERQLSAGGTKPVPAAASGALDWESQKRLLLAALEADDDKSAQGEEDRLTIDGTIRITDAVVADKDREIGELKQLLDEQSQSVGSVAVGAAALGEILDSDEIIRHQRERLEELQKEWEEKLRKAEIDISVERAKLARSRAELEEKQRGIDDQLRDQQKSSSSAGGNSAKQPPQRGRWLTRLGLKDDDGS